MQINENIGFANSKTVRVISDTGEQLGTFPFADALDMAYDRDLDLVLIAPQAKPPVCKIMDYGKYRYELQKKEKEAKKKQKTTEVKEVQLSTFIEEHDLQVKANNAIKFLKDGNKVKVRLRFRGRERSNTAAGEKTMEMFRVATEEFAVVEKAPLLEGRFLTMILGPKTDK